MALVRWILGRLILLFDALFTPRSLQRAAEAQAVVDRETARLALYQFAACPFCVKVRRAMKRHALRIETRDAKRHEQYRKELLQGGGQVKVPCLRIEESDGTVRWLYESGDIIRYLEGRFVPSGAAAPAELATDGR